MSSTNSRASGWFLAVTLTMAFAAAVVLALASMPNRAQADREQDFQRLVGGLGLGTALDLSGCPSQFDPRICPGCIQDRGPVAGGFYYCPYHATALFYYPPLTPAEHQVTEAAPHAPRR